MRAVIAMVGIGQYDRSGQFFLEWLGDHIVIDPPPFVIRSGVGPVTPPGVVMRILIKESEGVDKATIDELPYPLPLHG